ncbi:Histidine triad nucleotide-binding protein 3 [Lamellibrachia satsuma]|nr:Histidine triad nucleotide-binding protein 3 [Lamellibrachia satsuma]
MTEDDEVIVFHDIRPASTHHFLVCPVEHIRDASRLNKSHIPLVESMVAISKRLLEEREADFSQARLGIHWPPFISVSHFHIHVICPDDQIGFYLRAVGKFNPATYWFRSVDWLLERLKNLPDEPTSHETSQGSSKELALVMPHEASHKIRDESENTPQEMPNDMELVQGTSDITDNTNRDTT